MKCIILEDEPIALKILSDYIEKVPSLELAGTFRDPLKGLTFLQNNEVDLLFLDINMPDLSGIQFLKSLINPPLVIFTTAYSEYALQSYEYNTVDYLLKPIEFDRFLKAVNKALERNRLPANKKISQQGPSKPLTNEGNDFITVKSGTEFRRLLLEDILYIEGSGNYVTFATDKGKVLSLMKLKELEEILTEPGFLRIHKSYIIPLSKVDVFESFLVKIGDKKIPIGNAYRDKLIKILNI